MQDKDAEALIELINQDMRRAMKDQDRLKLDTLRSVLARIHNTEAVPDQANTDQDSSPTSGAVAGVGNSEAQRAELSLADVLAVIQAEKQEIEQTLAQIDETNEYTELLTAKLGILEGYIK